MNKPDPALVREHLERALAPSIRFADPSIDVSGIDGFETLWPTASRRKQPFRSLEGIATNVRFIGISSPFWSRLYRVPKSFTGRYIAKFRAKGVYTGGRNPRTSRRI